MSDPSKMLLPITNCTGPKMFPEPRLFEQPPTPATASAIIISSDEDEPPRKKAKIDDKTKKQPMNKMAAYGPPGAHYRLPAANLPAPQNHSVPNSASSDAFILAPHLNVAAIIDDIMSTGLEYLEQLRQNDDLHIDPNLRKLLLDPLPGIEKPIMIGAANNVPDKLYEYFYILTFHTNKIFAVAYIWLDLFINHDIYIAFKAICSIQERLLWQCKHALGWVEGVQLDQQSAAIRIYVRGMMASTQLLEAWAKSEDGIKYRREMKMAVEDKEEDEVRFVDDMLARVSYNGWKSSLDLREGRWMFYVNQRFQ